MKKEKVKLPEGYDPYDKMLKKLFNEKADKLNLIGEPSGYPQLLCGAVRKGKPCKKAAGSGTSHSGYGRCKYHGGASTGPKSPEGKAIVAQNSAKHGFYRNGVTDKEFELLKQVTTCDISVEAEIAFWKIKIIAYLTRHASAWERFYTEKKHLGNTEAAEYADKKIRRNDNPRSYHSGTIEDKSLNKALDVLGRLVEAHAKLNNLDAAAAGNILDQINAELKAASFGQVSITLE